MTLYYDVVAFGTGSAMNIVSRLLNMGKKVKVAVIENNMVGGICLTRGCIPSKMVLYPAVMIRRIKEANKLGINVTINSVNFREIMERTYSTIINESRIIEKSIIEHPSIDLYKTNGVFVEDYTVDVGGKEIEGGKILLCTGSKPQVPPIPGIEDAGYLTSDTFFRDLRNLPKRFVVIGGGYVGVELGFFLSMMGSKVSIIEIAPRILLSEEPEISELFQRDLSRYVNIKVNHRVVEVRRKGEVKVLTVEDMITGNITEIEADEILVATGRASYSDITRPEKTGVKTDEKGWILTDEYLRTSKEDIWSCGDANGKYMFKHKANYESEIVFQNAFLNKEIKVSYHAVPHAIFTEPEVASVGMKEEEAIKKHDVLIGYYLYEDTAKGEAMMVKDYFAKVIVEKGTYRILGAHIIGPEASVLIQEIVNLMYTDARDALPILRGMHIHPALSEVVERAFYNLGEPEEWRHHHDN